jgi:hypothetical protein
VYVELEHFRIGGTCPLAGCVEKAGPRRDVCDSELLSGTEASQLGDDDDEVDISLGGPVQQVIVGFDHSATAPAW